MRSITWCVSLAGRTSFGLFQAIAYIFGSILFLLVGIFTLMPSVVALCKFHDIDTNDTVLTIIVLVGSAAGICFFFSAVSWLESDREKRFWLRIASVVLPVICVVILLTTVEFFLRYCLAAPVSLDKSQAALFVMLGICLLATLGQYALATHIIYGKIRTATQKNIHPSQVGQGLP